MKEIEHMGPRPCFSVVLPTHSRPALLVRAIASVLRQSFADFELIVVDDGSPRLPARLVEEYSDCRVRFVQNEGGAGVASARNRGIAMARGEYVSFLDDDDEYLPSFLVRTYEVVKDSAASVALSWSGVRLVDYSHNSGRASQTRTREFKTSYPGNGELFCELLSVGIGHGVTIKRQCLDQTGGFNPRLKVVEDADLFLKVIGAGFLPTVVPGIHVVIHNHHGARLTDVDMHPIRIEEAEWLMKEHAGLLDAYPQLREQIARRIEFLRNELFERVSQGRVVDSARVLRR